MKTCQNCNTQNNDNANYCRHCGSVFPDTLKKNKKTSVPLIKKIEDLQLLIQSYTKKLSSAKNELDELKEENSTLSSKNSSLQAEISRKDKRITSADNEIENLKKEMESLSSSKVVLHILYIVVISILSTALLSYCNNENNNEYQAIISNPTDNNEQIDALQNENNTLKEQNSELNKLLNSINGDKSMYIKSIEVRNQNEPYGQVIYSQNTTYINPKIELFSFVGGEIDLYVKFLTPGNILSTATDNSSPQGYSYKEKVYVFKEQTNTIEMMGWGNDEKGHWAPGKYRIELYFKDQLIGYKDFTIH